DRLGTFGLAPTTRETCLDDRLEIVDVVEVATVDLVHGRIHVPRNREIDEEERAPLPLANVAGADHEARRAGAGDDDVGRRQLLLESLERQRGRAEAAREVPATLVGTIRNGDELGPARGETPSRKLADLARAHDHDAAAGEVSEDLLRERRTGGRDRRGALGDRRLRTSLLAGVERVV